MKNRRTKRIMSAVLCMIICGTVIFCFGRTYTVRIPVVTDTVSPQEVRVVIEDDRDCVMLGDISSVNGEIALTFSSLHRGRAFVWVYAQDRTLSGFRLYVHTAGLITYDSFFGPCRGDTVLPITICVLLLAVFTGILKRFLTDMAQDLYRYSNVTELGLMIFCAFLFANQLRYTVGYGGPVSVARSVLESTSRFAILVLPAAFVVWLLVSVSNVRLLVKEGFSWHNMLGLIMGILICLGTLTPLLVSDWLQQTTIVDVHNEQGIALYVESFIDSGIFSVIAYLECILTATIVFALKAARHIPSFDKDYILILGCQLNDDGSLTKLLSSRADRALEFASMQKEKSGRDIKYVPTGGKGDDEIMAEGSAIAQYLRSKGIDDGHILTEDRAENTLENMKYSMELIRKDTDREDPKIAFSTTNYHVFRSGLIASSQGIITEGIGSPTKSYFWINAFIREYVATLFSERKTHLRVLGDLVLINAAMVAVVYLSNIL